MKTFEVVISTVHHETYIVKAETAEEARDNWGGECVEDRWQFVQDVVSVEESEDE